MSGFDCQFVEEPPKYLQSHCPICLLVLREPFQVTCCGKSFCRQCIQQINTGGKPCPTCNEAKFDLFQNKGLQQPLYGFKMFCSNKESGCDWQGELGQLDQHLNLNPDKDKLPVGCAYTEVNCLYCNEPYPRHGIELHHASQCAERPFTCSLCEEYESTYTDIITNHSPVCKCRPVECPNSCGTNNLQHQHLEEHVSTQCPLSYVECEFSDAGCNAKVYRKDLPSHLGENMVTHMSLLARENRKLKQQLKDQEKNIQVQEEKVAHLLVEVQEHTEKIRHHFLPVDLCSDMFHTIKTNQSWLSKPFYNINGHMLQLELCLVSKSKDMFNGEKYFGTYKYRYVVLGSDFVVPPIKTLHITAYIIDEAINVINHDLEYKMFLGEVSKFQQFKVEGIFLWTFRVSKIVHF